MAFKNPDPIVNKLTKNPFRYAEYLDDINNSLQKDAYLDEIDLGDGYLLQPRKAPKVYGHGQDYNIEFDIINGDDIIDTMGIYGRKFDEDYQTQLQDIIDKHRNGAK